MDITLQIIDAFLPPLWWPCLIEQCRNPRYWHGLHSRRLALQIWWHQLNCCIAWQYHQHDWLCHRLTPTFRLLKRGAQPLWQIIKCRQTNKCVCPTAHMGGWHPCLCTSGWNCHCVSLAKTKERGGKQQLSVPTSEVALCPLPPWYQANLSWEYDLGIIYMFFTLKSYFIILLWFISTYYSLLSKC